MINQLKLEKDILSEIETNYQKTTGLNYLFHQSWEFYDGNEKNDYVVIMVDLKELAFHELDCLYQAKLDIYLRVSLEQDETFAVIQTEIDNINAVIPYITADYDNGNVGKVTFVKSSKDNNEVYRVMQFEYSMLLSEHEVIDFNIVPTA
jgi:hypothetical protein